MKTKIAVVTTTRADYSLLYPIVEKLKDDKEFDLQFVVSGTHLSHEYGYTIKDIEEDSLPIAMYIDILQNCESVTEIYANTINMFANSFEKLTPDAVIVLGDRYEIMAIASVCLLKQIPLIHISGGDTTFGAIDDACRHAITKMACLHFTGNELMRKRVIQLGENPSTVFDVGEPGIENLANEKLLSLEEIDGFKNFELLPHKYALVTYHPVTLEHGDEIRQIENLFDALESFSGYKFVVTASNCDTGGKEINEYIENRIKTKNNFMFISSLGRRRFKTVMTYAAAVIGNSSSGIVEAPFVHVPTVNIGNRQEGRMKGTTIVNCGYETEEIIAAINKAFSNSFFESCKNAVSLYGDGHTSDKIIAILHQFATEHKLINKKYFFDLEFNI